MPVPEWAATRRSGRGQGTCWARGLGCPERGLPCGQRSRRLAAGRAAGRDAQPPGLAPGAERTHRCGKQPRAGQTAAKKTPREGGVGETLGTGGARALTMIKLASPDFPARQRWAGTQWFILCKSPGSGSMNVSGWNSPRAAGSRYAARAIKASARAGLAHRHQPPRAHEQRLAAARRAPSPLSGLAAALGSVVVAEGTGVFPSGAFCRPPARDSCSAPLPTRLRSRGMRLVFIRSTPVLPPRLPVLSGVSETAGSQGFPPAPGFVQRTARFGFLWQGLGALPAAELLGRAACDWARGLELPWRGSLRRAAGCAVGLGERSPAPCEGLCHAALRQLPARWGRGLRKWGDAVSPPCPRPSLGGFQPRGGGESGPSPGRGCWAGVVDRRGDDGWREGEPSLTQLGAGAVAGAAGWGPPACTGPGLTVVSRHRARWRDLARSATSSRTTSAPCTSRTRCSRPWTCWDPPGTAAAWG